MKRLFFLFVWVICLSAPAAGQQLKCGADYLRQYLLEHDPGYARTVAEQNRRWEQYCLMRQNTKIIVTPNDTVYEIPVVVHVVHTGDAVGTQYNPTDQQIQDWIAYCNQVFAAQFSLFPDTLQGGVYIPIRFALASRDPDCNPTNGIQRVDGSVLPHYVTEGVSYHTAQGAADSAVKSLSRWPGSSYYNIWLVNMINSTNGNIAGYAYYPGTPHILDGAVIITKHAHPDFYHQAVLPHELGHALGIAHTFDGDNNGTSCPPDYNCATDGDGICDTEPHIQPSSGCPSGINPCTGANYNGVQYNIMNYSSCPNRFTPGQREKMLFSLLNYRYSLLTSLGTTPPGNNDIVTPSININADPGTLVSVGTNVMFYAVDTNGGGEPEYEWRKNGEPVSNTNAEIWFAIAGTDFVSGDTITVRLISDEPCARPDTAISNALVMQVAPASINDPSNKSRGIRLYPNPAASALSVITAHPGNELVIYDIAGRPVLKQSLNAQEHLLDIRALSPGVYFYRYASENGKFVKE